MPASGWGAEVSRDGVHGRSSLLGDIEKRPGCLHTSRRNLATLQWTVQVTSGAVSVSHLARFRGRGAEPDPCRVTSLPYRSDKRHACNYNIW